MDSYDSLEQKLDAVHKWPCDYTFKFVVTADQYDRLLSMLPPGDVATRASATSRYTAVTLKAPVDSAKAVTQVYKNVAEIPGLVAL